MSKSIFNKTESAPVIAEAKGSTVKKSPYEAVAFLNMDAVVPVEIDGETVDITFKPTGARFTRKWSEENPKIWEALQLVDDPHTKFECEFTVLRGEELRRIELDQMEQSLSDELKSILALARATASPQEYTNFVRVVGDLYLKTKKGKVKLDGVFLPSFDFRIGMEGKYVESQAHLINAVLQGTTIEWESRSFEVVKDKEEVDFDLEDLL